MLANNSQEHLGLCSQTILGRDLTVLQVYLIPFGAGKFSQSFHTAYQHSQSYFTNRSVLFCLQQHWVEAELQVLFRHFNTLAVTNSGSDTFPFSCFSWTSRDHCHHPTLLPAFTCGFSSSGSPEELTFHFLSLMNCMFTATWHEYIPVLTRTPFPVTPGSCSDVGLYP